MWGVLGSAGAAICLAPYSSALSEWNLGQAIDAVTGTRLCAEAIGLRTRIEESRKRSSAILGSVIGRCGGRSEAHATR